MPVKPIPPVFDVCQTRGWRPDDHGEDSDDREDELINKAFSKRKVQTCDPVW